MLGCAVQKLPLDRAAHRLLGVAVLVVGASCTHDFDGFRVGGASPAADPGGRDGAPVDGGSVLDSSAAAAEGAAGGGGAGGLPAAGAAGAPAAPSPEGARDARVDAARDARPDSAVVDAGSALDAAREASIRDARSEPESAADAANATDAAPSCDMLFGSAIGYLLCSETPTTCSFNTTLAQTTCNDLCASLGSVCVSALDNNGPPCVAVSFGDTCATVRNSEICECERP